MSDVKVENKKVSKENSNLFNNADELEIKLAFLEDTIAKLSDEFYLQQRDLDDLRAKYNSLVNKVLNNANDDASGAEILDERPPHY